VETIGISDERGKTRLVIFAIEPLLMPTLERCFQG
jgi:hypothetical protein